MDSNVYIINVLNYILTIRFSALNVLIRCVFYEYYDCIIILFYYVIPITFIIGKFIINPINMN